MIKKKIVSECAQIANDGPILWLVNDNGLLDVTVGDNFSSISFWSSFYSQFCTTSNSIFNFCSLFCVVLLR
jgi:restriction endonuclease S subunit